MVQLFHVLNEISGDESWNQFWEIVSLASVKGLSSCLQMLPFRISKQAGLLVNKLNKCYKLTAGLNWGRVYFSYFYWQLKKTSLVWLSRCLQLTLKWYHLFRCWRGQKRMGMHISSLAGWARCFSGWCSCWLFCFCVICCLATPGHLSRLAGYVVPWLELRHWLGSQVSRQPR